MCISGKKQTNMSWWLGKSGRRRRTQERGRLEDAKEKTTESTASQVWVLGRLTKTQLFGIKRQASICLSRHLPLKDFKKKCHFVLGPILKLNPYCFIASVAANPLLKCSEMTFNLRSRHLTERVNAPQRRQLFPGVLHCFYCAHARTPPTLLE